MSEERGLEDICLAMGRHNADVELVEAACSALWSLSMEGKNFSSYSVGRSVYPVLSQKLFKFPSALVHLCLFFSNKETILIITNSWTV